MTGRVNRKVRIESIAEVFFRYGGGSNEELKQAIKRAKQAARAAKKALRIIRLSKTFDPPNMFPYDVFENIRTNLEEERRALTREASLLAEKDPDLFKRCRVHFEKGNARRYDEGFCNALQDRFYLFNDYLSADFFLTTMLSEVTTAQRDSFGLFLKWAFEHKTTKKDTGNEPTN